LWRQVNGFPPSLYEEPLDQAINKSVSTNEEKSEEK
jgi:hypothetical protein